MLGLFANGALFAQAEGAAPAAGGGASSPLSMLPAFGLMAVAFYFLLIRPQRRQEAERKAMISTLKKNDRVVTVAGIYGKVNSVRPEEDEVTVMVDEGSNTKLRMTISSIARVLTDETAAAGDTNK
ncbi:MAG: preprotein translocase subunit YajC [Pirellulales bacterium]